jgi:hypothetical protein
MESSSYLVEVEDFSHGWHDRSLISRYMMSLTIQVRGTQFIVEDASERDKVCWFETICNTRVNAQPCSSFCLPGIRLSSDRSHLYR